MKNDSAFFTLRFVSSPHVTLRATELRVRVMDKPDIVKATEGKAGDGYFEWRQGTQALCVCLLQYLCYSREQLNSGIAFIFRGSEQTPAKTLDGVIAKSNKANSWPGSIFGALSNGGCRLRRYMIRHRASPGAAEKVYEVEVQHAHLPQENIFIEIDGRMEKDLAKLKSLSETIEDQWFSITGYKDEWNRVKAARQASQVIDNTESLAQNPEEASSTPRKSSSLIELFKLLSVHEIKSHIVAALMPGRGAEYVAASMVELLSPECVYLLAQKVTTEPIDSFLALYAGLDFDLQNLKKSIAAVIATDRGMRKRLTESVAQCGFVDMKDWFVVFEPFCSHEIFMDLDMAVGAAAESTGFKERFLPYAPERLPSLIKYYSDHNCVLAVRIFERINNEGKEEDLRVQGLLNRNDAPPKL